jgi:hypothetical protein
MTRIFFAFLIGFLFTTSCKKKNIIDSREVIVRIQYDQTLIPNATVYMKFNDCNFPGYDLNKLEIFDDYTLVEVGQKSLFFLPSGTHWLVVHGRNEELEPNGKPVRGSIRINLTETTNFLDTIIYVQEY